MIQYLLTLFGSGSIHKTSFVLKMASEIISALDNQLGADANAKDTAIDLLNGLLSGHKQVNAPAKPIVVPVVSQTGAVVDSTPKV